MNDTLYVILQISVMALVTAMIRFLPFIIFRGDRKTPAFITYLGTVLPCAVMAMLVVYCLKSVSFITISGWLPALAGILTVVILHIIKRNTLLSIISGTAVYMILISII